MSVMSGGSSGSTQPSTLTHSCIDFVVEVAEVHLVDGT